MGHMNALDRVKRQSKSQREKDALIEDTVVRFANLYSKALAKANYDVNKHHNVRTERLIQRMFDVVDEYIDRFGADCAEIALDKDLKDLGINVVIRDKGGNSHGKTSEGGQLQDRNMRFDGMPDLREDICPGGVSCLSRIRSRETEASMLVHVHDRGGET